MTSTFGERNTKTSTTSITRKSGTFPAPTAASACGGETAATGGWWNLDKTAGNPCGKNSLFVPFGYGRKGLPSKWEDAEKWILSPVTVDGKNQAMPPHCRRPKSKSGPLRCPAGLGCERPPPFVQMSAANSPLMTGVLFADRACFGSGSTGRRADGGSTAHEWESKVVLDSSFTPTTSQDANTNIRREASSVLPVISMKDVATQMSPNNTILSSDPSPSRPPKCNTFPRSPGFPLCGVEVRDVQVDDPVTTSSRWSKKHIFKGFERDSAKVFRWKKNDIQTLNCTTKEQIKINAWESLQIAKAEAAIQKLEMELEKQRSSSMDKIHSKLKAAQRKAQEMRNVVASGQTPRQATIDRRAAAAASAAIVQKTRRKFSVSGWFSCHAF